MSAVIALAAYIIIFTGIALGIYLGFRAAKLI